MIDHPLLLFKVKTLISTFQWDLCQLCGNSKITVENYPAITLMHIATGLFFTAIATPFVIGMIAILVAIAKSIGDGLVMYQGVGFLVWILSTILLAFTLIVRPFYPIDLDFITSLQAIGFIIVSSFILFLPLLSIVRDAISFLVGICTAAIIPLILIYLMLSGVWTSWGFS